jgi:RNA polymerase sigma factor (sigma-70 family)
VVDLERGIPSCDEVSDPSSLAEEAEIQGQLLRAVEALPPGIREAVALYYYGGMNVSGVAEVMGLGVENVKSRLHRGRKAVRAYLGRRDATMPPAREYTPVRRSERGSCHG